MGRYFLVSALEVDSNIRKSLTKRSGRVINRFKEKNNIFKNVELKGSNLNRMVLK